MNQNSGWYETFFRGYDPAIGRFLQVDPKSYSEQAVYQYAANNPVYYNDPAGSDAWGPRASVEFQQRWIRDFGSAPDSWFSGGSWSSDIGDGGGGRNNRGTKMSMGEFIGNALYQSDHGGHWEGGYGYMFESEDEAFAAGIAYNDYHDSWGNTEHGSVEGSFIAREIIKATGKIPDASDVYLILHPEARNMSVCNEPNCTHGVKNPVDPNLAKDWKDYAGLGLDISDDMMEKVRTHVRSLQAESNTFRLGLNFGKELGKVNATTSVIKWGARGLGAYNAYNIEMQYRDGQINGTTRALEQGTNIISTFGGLYGASWGLGWEIGRAITTIPAYQNWKQNTWLPWRERNLGY